MKQEGKTPELLVPELREGAARGILQLGQAAAKSRKEDSDPRAFIDLARTVLTRTRTN